MTTMARTPEQKYQTALDKIYQLIDKVQELESELERLKDGVSEEVIEANEEWEELDVVVFLRDIGFDPDNLPNSLGERMAIRDAIAAARVLR